MERPHSHSFALLLAGLALGWLPVAPGSWAGSDQPPETIDSRTAGPQTPGVPTTPTAEPASPGTPNLPGATAPSARSTPLQPGYVPDAECAKCHRELAESFREVGMGRSFGRPDPAEGVEDFSAPPFFHEPSQRWYQVTLRDGRPVFRRWQEDGNGEPINLFEQPVEWVLGSGHRARSYLFSNPAGELYVLPVSWYSGAGLPGDGEPVGHWGMAPGFDRADHAGVARPVQRECFFCHNAYPGPPDGTHPAAADGADLHGMPDRFPAELPHGIGCQRCHGPGAEHVDLAAGGLGTMDAVRAAIVNPGRLPPKLRDDVCWQCHMQPSVSLPGLRRLGLGDWDYRPGTPLPDFNVHLEIVETARARDGQRFEINHHPYRLIQSRCWQESDRRLSCLTCHDPHRKVPPAERAAHYRAACLSCHGEDACGREHGTGADAHRARAHATDDCVACHMPPRRTQDVVQVVMTDHRIQRHPPPESARLAPLAETDPVLEDVHRLDVARDDRMPTGDELQLYRAVAVARIAGGASPDALDYLEAVLPRRRPEAPDAHLDLAKGLLQRGEAARAEPQVRAALERSPEHPEALLLLGVLHLTRGEAEEAVAVLRRAATAGAPAEVHYNLANALLATGDAEAARAELETAVARRPTFSSAWIALGRLRERLGGRDGEAGAAAADAYRRALALRPERPDAYLALGQLLLARGEREEAVRWLAHGARVARPPEPVRRLLDQARGPAAE